MAVVVAFTALRVESIHFNPGQSNASLRVACMARDSPGVINWEVCNVVVDNHCLEFADCHGLCNVCDSSVHSYTYTDGRLAVELVEN